jgi:hypothetical protein
MHEHWIPKTTEGKIAAIGSILSILVIAVLFILVISTDPADMLLRISLYIFLILLVIAGFHYISTQSAKEQGK